MKHIVSKVIVGVFALGFLLNPCIKAVAEVADTNTTGTLNIKMEEQNIKLLEQYAEENPEDGSGVFVYIKSLSDDIIYKFPVSQENNYEGRFEIPYGNYQMIDYPKAKTGQVVAYNEDVFAISETNPIIDYTFNLKIKESKKPKITTAPKIKKDKVNNQQQVKKAPLTVQNIITIIALIAILALWVYNRFIKNRR